MKLFEYPKLASLARAARAIFAWQEPFDYFATAKCKTVRHSNNKRTWKLDMEQQQRNQADDFEVMCLACYPLKDDAKIL